MVSIAATSRLFSSSPPWRGKAETTVITFDRHPHATLRPGEEPLPIVSESQKVELLSQAGIARVVVLPFDDELSALSHEEFSRIVLAEGLSAAVVLVGGDFRYGHGGEGNYRHAATRRRTLGFSGGSGRRRCVKNRANGFLPP